MHTPPVPILSQINPVHALHPTSCRYTLILFSHLCLFITSGLFPSGLPPNLCMHLFFSSTCPMHCPSHSSNLINRIIFDEYKSWSYALCNLPIPCYLDPFSTKYLPQHPILQHPQPMFLCQCERTCPTSIQNRQNYSSVYFCLYVFGCKPERKITARIPWIQSAIDFVVGYAV